ncbi:ADP-ribosyl cyclase/cyclic ADP-ribose hydrolase [Citrus sinensis]|uniref:ADP-ribosyl cyclase/cyclic ADP-ribose hydrolase n=1 Tax=Citrus sinensis TaxID=2711 RepID=A0ACB8M8V4_CITSI|nr:ADP-ribosyl cyclase/cyclic ADP-ribose hydrolase [Citrus sinensis]
MNRTIEERVRYMLSDAKLPKSFLAEAIRTIVDLINLSPSAPLEDVRELKCFEKAMSHQHNSEWVKTIQEEMKSLNENHTYDLVKLPKGKRALKNKWVYRLKTESNSQQRYKAKLVYEGFWSEERHFIGVDQINQVASFNTLKANGKDAYTIEKPDNFRLDSLKLPGSSMLSSSCEDDKQLEKGGSISPNLLKAIEESRISIIVLSRNYASSTWCLDELVKIVEYKNREDQIFPIFYDVEPTAVRKQTTSFGEAFTKHEEFFRDNIEKVQKWRHALKVVANISGWELKDSNESEFIEEIVNVISSKIRTESEILKELVGIESRLEKLKFLMGAGCNDVRMIGIWGMGGLGKTTLARVVYDLISHEFDGSSFLADVKEKYDKEGSVISLQKQLISDLLKLADNNIRNVYDGINMIGRRLRQKKVLLVIDDVAHVEQLRRLAGKRDWFGPGSRIIITTRDEHLLKLHRVEEVFKLEALTYDEAFQLFCLKAFETQKPREEYVHLSQLVVNYAGGLPLALKVLGSFLFGRPVDEWTSTLERLKREPENEILDILQISFDGLKEAEKEIFLDVACFFKGEKRDYVSKILDSCGFEPVIGIGVLIEKSLLTICESDRLWMHDLLLEMGRQIVRRQSPREPGKRSRLWEEADLCHVLSQNTGSEVVEGRILDDYYFLQDKVYLSASPKAFSKMTNLRLLKICGLQLPQGLEHFSNNLRLLDWHGYPWKSLPSNLQLDKTVEFKMCYSCIEELWKGIKAVSDPSHKFSIVVPGSEIPEWFMYQNEGSSITVTRPSYLYNMNKVVGYAICCVFHVSKHSTGTYLWRSYSQVELHCSMDGSNVSHFIRSRGNFGHAGSDHLWLFYLSRQECYNDKWHFESNHFKLSFIEEGLYGRGTDLNVKRYGFHPVYMHEVEELDQATKQWTHFTSYNLYESPHDFVGSNMEVATTSKQSLADNAGTTEASGSGCCDEDEEPPPKRFRQFK